MVVAEEWEEIAARVEARLLTAVAAGWLGNERVRLAKMVEIRPEAAADGAAAVVAERHACFAVDVDPSD